MILRFFALIIEISMAKKTFVLILLCLLAPAWTLPPKTQVTPLWWEIKILLVSDGRYKINEPSSAFSGRYGFTILWTGCMEINDDDFLLYYENSELLSFEAEEKGGYPNSTRILSTDDFKDRPSFHLNYILRKDEGLYFDFIVYGFQAPLNESKYKFYLNLPESEENPPELSEIDYDSFVSKGSNLIFLEEKKIHSETVEKKSSWEWNYQKWRLVEKMPVFFSNSHEVTIDISVKPHFSNRSLSSARKQHLRAGRVE